jgi:hypothetical protein
MTCPRLGREVSTMAWGQDSPQMDISRLSSFTNADSPGGLGRLSQTLSGVCPGQRYNFEAYFGRSNNIIGGSKLVTTIRVLLDGVEVLPPTFYCPLGATDCPIPGGNGPWSRRT